MNRGSRVVEEIKKLQQETKSEFLTLEAGQTAVVKLELNEDRSINGDIFERKFRDKVSKAFKFPVTLVNTGERKMLGLALRWTDCLIDRVERKQQNVVEITRHS